MDIAFAFTTDPPYPLQIPDSFGRRYTIPANNPMTVEGVALGAGISSGMSTRKRSKLRL